MAFQLASILLMIEREKGKVEHGEVSGLYHHKPASHFTILIKTLCICRAVYFGIVLGRNANSLGLIGCSFHNFPLILASANMTRLPNFFLLFSAGKNSCVVLSACYILPIKYALRPPCTREVHKVHR